MAKEVGRVTVRALPDTKGFKAELKNELSRIEKSVKGQIQLDPVLDKTRLQGLMKALSGLRAEVKLDLDAGHVREQIKSIASDTTATVKAVADTAVAKAELAKLSKTATQAKIAAKVDAVSLRSAKAEIARTLGGTNVDVGVRTQSITDSLKTFTGSVTATLKLDLKEARQQLRDFIGDITVKVNADTREAKNQIQNLGQGVSATVNADADTRLAATKLSLLTRPRWVDIAPKINSAAFAATKAALMSLSGGNIMGDLNRGLRETFLNLDRVALNAAGTGLAVTGLGAAAIGGAGNLFTLASSLGAVAPAALALPGMFAGAAVGVTVMAVALKDAGKQLGDLKPAFQNLQSSISNAFWQQAAQPIRDMANSLLPALTAEMSGTATQIGSLFGSLSSALQSSLGGGVLASLFAPLNQSISIAAQGMAPLVQGIVNLGRVGGQFLPGLASGFVDIANSFERWTQTADIAGMIRGGIQALKELFNVAVQVVGIFGAVANAASKAGGSTLASIGEGLRQVNAALSGPVGQGAMVTIFEGANKAIRNLGPGLSALGGAFVSLAPTISTVMQSASQSISGLAQGVAAALQNPVFQQGLTTFFKGIQDGVAALQPSMGSLGTIFGSLGKILGPIATQLGGVLGAAFDALAPVVQTLADSLQPLIPLLGQALTTAIKGLGPVLESVAAALGPVADMLGQAFLAAIEAVLPIIQQLVPALAPLAGELLVALLDFLRQILPPLSEMVQALLPVIVQVMKEVVPIVADLVKQLAPIVGQLIEQLAPVLGELVEKLLPPLLQILKELAPVIPPLVDLVGQLATFLGTVLVGAIEALLPIVETVFKSIADIIGGALDYIKGLLEFWTGVFTGDWDKAWQGMRDMSQGVWDMIVALIKGALGLIVAAIKDQVGTLGVDWDNLWNAIKIFAQQVWDNMVNAAKTFITNLATIIANTTNAIKDGWSAIWGGIKGAALSIWNGIKSGISGAINNVRDTIGNVLNNIRNTWSNIWNSLSSLVSGIFGGIIRAIGGAMSNIANAVSSGVGQVVSFFSGMGSRIMGAISSVASNMWSAGADMIRGLINGIQSMGYQVADAARRVAQNAIDAAKRALRIHSPSRVFMEIGAYTGEGMAIGIDGSARDVQKAMEAMVSPPDARLAAVVPPAVSPAGADGMDGASSADSPMDLLVAALSGWRPVVNIGGREFKGVMEETNRRYGGRS